MAAFVWAGVSSWIVQGRASGTFVDLAGDPGSGFREFTGRRCRADRMVR
ncbi:hypothetical protein [Lentzea sp. NPDC055074]